MTEVQKNLYYFRQWLLLAFLLCAFLHGSIGVTAYKAVPFALASSLPDQAASEGNASHLIETEQYFSQHATRAFGTFKLKHAKGNLSLNTHTFAVADTVPLYAARASGVNFFSLIFTTSIQPQAP